ncbi:MAG: sigma 54-interacting transcriptional regulator [Deltaproteobacteria bacterium]|nr:sigma 54-interacting transcriptional regulator [Deltaproteobacteria bacterium]
MKKILIIDDDVAVTNYLKVFLTQTGLFDIFVVNDSREVFGLLDREALDLILLDMDMPNVSGINILNDMRGKGLYIPVVVLTGVGDVDLAVNAMKLGVFDYLIKPVDDEKLLEVLDNAMEQRILHNTIDQLPRHLSRRSLGYEAAFEHFHTQDLAMIRLFHQAEKIASSNLSIFIWGERGTGKEALARAIHQASPRADKPFVVVEADSQDPEKFPAFFFGQARTWGGSYEETSGILEEADQGTLFLSHVDTLGLAMQVRLKRVIQTGEYCRENSARVRNIDVRMIVSSTQDLTSRAYEDKFSRDLLYHLMVNSIRIPSLRERVDDIILLAEHFLQEETKRTGKKITGFSGEFLECLKGYSFPDNVQELRTIVAGAVASAETKVITEDYLPPYIRERIKPKTYYSKDRDIILDSVADGIFTVDRDWKITSFNRAAEKITGVKRQQAIGQKCFDVFQAEICQSACALKHSIKSGKEIINRRINIINNKGQTISVSISTAVLRDEKGNVIGGAETFRDLSV